jgi:hypothetical protein
LGQVQPDVAEEAAYRAGMDLDAKIDEYRKDGRTRATSHARQARLRALARALGTFMPNGKRGDGDAAAGRRTGGAAEGHPKTLPFLRGQAAPALDVDTSAIRRHFESVRGAKSFTDYLEAGWQNSVTGWPRAGAHPRSRSPRTRPGTGGSRPRSPRWPATRPRWWRASPAALWPVVQRAPRFPSSATHVGATVGGFAGAGALPAGLRSAMMEMYEKGDVTSSSDFIERALHVAWETGKGGLIGAATGGAGVVAKGRSSRCHACARARASVTAAEVGALATVGKGLEGQLPEPQDFLDAAVLLGGVKTAGATAAKLRTIYSATGKAPMEVLADAKANPKLLEQLRASPPRAWTASRP